VLSYNASVATGSPVAYVPREESLGMPARPQRVDESRPRTSGLASRDYIEKTRAFWQPHADRTLTREDAREMAHNLLGFFSVLREWTIRERERERLGIAPLSPPPPRMRGRPRKNAAAKKEMLS
jgi:hypothetical protein